jgi:hypothetical protein
MRAIRLAGIYAALAAMLLGALTPAGWMPDPDSAGSFTICTVNGPVSPGPANKDQDDSRHQPCPFAAMPHLAALPGLAAIQLPSLAAATIYAPSHLAAALDTRRREPQSPRAPPGFA